jgi:hypothetical protein
MGRDWKGLMPKRWRISGNKPASCPHGIAKQIVDALENAHEKGHHPSRSGLVRDYSFLVAQYRGILAKPAR